ncbi:enoyl-CoA hydratase/isomerase family protein [Microbacterium marinilacus]|uniref:3-hydroxyisobutyryl-CoA hydrolase n=1 Tax=Microbacterium marinilacus TaxID=415209 RepID=A0ABP7BL12_9MICO|nr:enoyl-CoA hydratase/isomerase family protein [Microbacterium marinilacus]MBY0689689.1 enoyl-CoA hydratase/isomerase family protein [Microbacterium marinilacus]
MTFPTPDPRVLARREGGLGTITLNRPEAINALDVGMIEAIAGLLAAWRDDPDVQVVLFDGAGERGFSSGGDVRGLHASLARGDASGPDRFFRAEYTMNAAIGEYAKPVVAFADGVTMGGGIGIAGHAHVRVVTERSQLAMPETRLGFTPDAGGSWLLGRAPGRVGEFLALTSWVMGPADAIHAGFADHLVPAVRLPSLREALTTRADPSTPTELVLLFDETPEAGPIERARPWIDDAFAADTVPEILERLQALADAGTGDGDEVSPRAVLGALADRAPVGLTVSLAAVRSSRALPGLRAALEQEYGLVTWFMATQPDLPEGIRAQLVDRDRAPRWSPPSLAGVPADLVGEAFAHEPERRLFAVD